MPKWPKSTVFCWELSAIFLAGKWTRSALMARCRQAFPKDGFPEWIPQFVKRTRKTFPQPPSREVLFQFIHNDLWQWNSFFREDVRPLQQLGLVDLRPRMSPHLNIAIPTPLPSLVTAGELAEWLGLSLGQLDWFADCHGRERDRTAEALRHYSYRWIAKKHGPPRLLESPKRKLREIQRLILAEILNRIPIHNAAHGFCRGRSVKSFVKPHCGQAVLLRMDLRNFFTTISAGRVHGIYRTIGYPMAVARLLTGLCTNSVPDTIFRVSEVETNPERQRLFRSPHLPQGSPTSPGLANLCAFRLDCRLAGLADSWDVNYTRYADDLAFSGSESFKRRLHAFRIAVLAILLDEGFAIRHRKTLVASASERQVLAGVVVNQRPNVSRDEYDQLRAILHNCRRFGPQSQNRDGHADYRSHLQGRIGFVAMIHEGRGQKLQQMFDAIEW